jgi:hypothetical protein
MSQSNTATAPQTKITIGDILVLLIFPLLVPFSLIVLIGSKQIATAIGGGVPGFLAQGGGLILFFGAIFGYAVLYASILARKRKLDAERPYSDGLAAMMEEIMDAASPDDLASKRAFIEGFISGARSADDTLDRDDLTEKSLRQLYALPPRS